MFFRGAIAHGEVFRPDLMKVNGRTAQHWPKHVHAFIAGHGLMDPVRAGPCEPLGTGQHEALGHGVPDQAARMPTTVHRGAHRAFRTLRTTSASGFPLHPLPPDVALKTDRAGVVRIERDKGTRNRQGNKRDPFCQSLHLTCPTTSRRETPRLTSLPPVIALFPSITGPMPVQDDKAKGP